MLEPEGEVPTLDELQAELDGTGTESPQLGSDPFGPQGPGLVLADDEEKSVEKQKPDADQRIAALERSLAEAEKRREASAAEYYRADNARQIAEGVVQNLRAAQQKEEEAMRQLANASPPEPENLEELLEDPARLRAWIQDVGKWSVGTALAAMQPAWNQLQSISNTTQGMLGLSLRESFDRAKWETEKMGFEDFDDLKDELVQKFQAYGQDGARMMLDPERVVSGYLMLRREKKLPWRTSSSSGPDVLPSQPSMARGDSGATGRYSPMARQIASMLDIPSIKASRDELESVGLVSD